MFLNKIHNCLLVIVIIYVVAVQSEECVNICKIGDHGLLFFDDRIVKDAEEGKIQNDIIRISPEGSASDTKITCINITNLGDENSHCEVFEGGIGENILSVNLTSDLGKGFEYRIKIYAEPIESSSSVLTVFQLVFIIVFVIVVVAIMLLFIFPCKSDIKKSPTLQSIIDRLYYDNQSIHNLNV